LRAPDIAQVTVPTSRVIVITWVAPVAGDTDRVQDLITSAWSAA